MGIIFIYLNDDNSLHYGNGAVGEHPGDAVNTTDDGVAAEDMSPAVLAAEDGPLGEYG